MPRLLREREPAAPPATAPPMVVGISVRPTGKHSRHDTQAHTDPGTLARVSRTVVLRLDLTFIVSGQNADRTKLDVIGRLVPTHQVFSGLFGLRWGIERRKYGRLFSISIRHVCTPLHCNVPCDRVRGNSVAKSTRWWRVQMERAHHPDGVMASRRCSTAGANRPREPVARMRRGRVEVITPSGWCGVPAARSHSTTTYSHSQAHIGIRAPAVHTRGTRSRPRRARNGAEA